MCWFKQLWCGILYSTVYYISVDKTNGEHVPTLEWPPNQDKTSPVSIRFNFSLWIFVVVVARIMMGGPNWNPQVWTKSRPCLLHRQTNKVKMAKCIMLITINLNCELLPFQRAISGKTYFDKIRTQNHCKLWVLFSVVLPYPDGGSKDSLKHI